MKKAERKTTNIKIKTKSQMKKKAGPQKSYLGQTADRQWGKQLERAENKGWYLQCQVDTELKIESPYADSLYASS